MLDSLFMDQLGARTRSGCYNENNDVRRIEFLLMTPSRDVNEIARRHARELPREPRSLTRMMGAEQDPPARYCSATCFSNGVLPC